MPRHSLTLLRWISCLLLGQLLTGPSISPADELISRRPLPSTWRADAELRDIFFIDPSCGWAVGDCGTILRSTDGGVTWQEGQAMRAIQGQQQRMTREMKVLVELSREASAGLNERPLEAMPSPISATLESVSFIDAQRGWAIGGYSIPYVERSRAVVLKTNDGGATWIPQANLMAPRLVTARFQTATRGWAFGDAGYLFKSGFLTTSDGGLNWTTQANSERRGWRAGTITSGGFVGIDESGRLRTSRGGDVEAAVVQQRPLQPLQAVTMLDDQRGFAVGAAGTVLETRDGGSSWSMPAAIAGSEPLRHYDLQTVVAVGKRIWFAGNPGTHVFCYDTESETLTASRTGTLAGLNRLVFQGETSGWACGQFGTILRTSDEGQTWQICRGGNSDLALLSLSWDDALPAVEAMARHGAEDGLRTLACRILTRPAEQVSLHRSREAVVGAGSLGEVVIDCRAASSREEAWARIEQRLLLLIRQYRPRVIVSAESMLRLEDGSIVDVNELLQRVIRRAASAESELAQASATLTAPWQVSQVLLQQSGAGSWALADNLFLTRINRLLGDQVAHSRGLYGRSLARTEVIGFELRPCGDQLTFDNRGTLSESFRRYGIQLPQRSGTDTVRGNLREVQAAMAKGQQLQQLLGARVGTAGDQLVWQQAINQLLQSADEETTGNWLAELAERYLAQGKLSMAALSLEQLLTRVPHHGLSPAAQIWLAKFGASREAELALLPAEVLPTERTGDQTEEDEALFDAAVEAVSYESQIMKVEQDGIQKLVWVPQPQMVKRESGTTATTGTSLPAVSSSSKEEFWQAASRRINRVKQRDPELGSLPEMKWLEASATLQLAGWEAARPLVEQILRDPSTPEELRWLAQMTARMEAGNESEPLLQRVAKLDSPPWLDGSLEEAAWKSVSPLSRTARVSSGERPEDRVWLGHDDEYLYVAIRCHSLPGVAYRPLVGPRERDAKLDDHDRVTLSLDLDGDGLWPLTLSVDSRGAVADGCGGTVCWNPVWYVARQADQTGWTIEAAVPLSQLRGARPTAGTRWGLTLIRQAPWQSANLWEADGRGAELKAPLQTPLRGTGQIWLEFE